MTALLQAVTEEALLTAGQPVVVMFSGGRDSTCLLDLAVRIAGPPAVTAVHVNYGLRAAADADERHCAQLCEQLGVQLDVRRPARAAEPNPSGPTPPGAPVSGNLQAWAREERYRAAADLAVARAADVAAGHTRSDQVETILYRLASSPSRRALLGMRPREGALVRPLLRFTREETGDYCRERGLSWRDDESNESSAFARNRIRRELVPALERVHPAAQANILSVAEILRDEADVLDEVVAAALDAPGAAGDSIELGVLRELAPAVRRLVVQRLADEAIGRPAAGVARRAEEVAAMGDQAYLDLPRGVRAATRGGVLRFERRAGPGDQAQPGSDS